MLNGQGGDILIGVDAEDKTIYGIQEADFDELVSTIQKQITPGAPINVAFLEYAGKNIGLINIWEGSEKPYVFNHQIFTLASVESRKAASPQEVSALIDDRSRHDNDWEQSPVLDATLEDLDANAIERAMVGYCRNKGVQLSDTREFLDRVGLLKRDYITNAAIALFGREATKFLPQLRIRLTVYDSTQKTNVFLFDHIYNNGIIKDVADVYNMLPLIYGKTTIVNGALHEQKSNYPELALREGIINACVHHNMSAMRSFVHINIYSDRTEIDSFGGLLPEISLQDLLHEHRSVLRNPKVAEMCYYAGWMEMLGSGTLRMINTCRKEGFSTPEFSVDKDVMRVRFPGLGHHFRTPEDTHLSKQNIYIGIIEGLTEGLIEGISSDTKNKLASLLVQIESHPGANSVQLGTYMMMPQKTMERHLKTLRDLSLIRFKGSKRSGGYHLYEQ